MIVYEFGFISLLSEMIKREVHQKQIQLWK